MKKQNKTLCESNEDFSMAYYELFMAWVKFLRIDKFCNWLEKKL